MSPRTLSDSRLAIESASLDELAESIGLARSTAHHDLAQLKRRSAGRPRRETTKKRRPAGG
jgi:DNA-binding IclR family transcriptional regulator